MLYSMGPAAAAAPAARRDTERRPSAAAPLALQHQLRHSEACRTRHNEASAIKHTPFWSIATFCRTVRPRCSSICKTTVRCMRNGHDQHNTVVRENNARRQRLCAMRGDHPEASNFVFGRSVRSVDLGTHIMMRYFFGTPSTMKVQTPYSGSCVIGAGATDAGSAASSAKPSCNSGS